MYLKWVGGKTKIAGKVMSYFPDQINGSYIEPFFGSGAMYFAISASNSEPDLFNTSKFSPSKLLFNDSNPYLVNCHLSVKMKIDELEEILREKEELHKQDPFGFYSKEKANVTILPCPKKIKRCGCDIDQAATFIYINKTCFNGLWRVNQSGLFNVPWNTETTVNLATSRLRLAHKELKNCDIKLGDYSDFLENVENGDFVYLDPPYVPLSKTSHFTSYTKEGFSLEDLQNLKYICDKMNSNGIKWCMSNSTSNYVYEYFSNYSIHEIDAPRFIKPIKDNGKRETVKEAIVMNY